MDQDAGPLQRIAADVRLGRPRIFRDFVNLYGCSIGDDTRIGTFVEIQKNASIGARCKISSHTFICEGVTIEDEVLRRPPRLLHQRPLPAGHARRAGCRPRPTGKSSRRASAAEPRSARARSSCAA